MPQIEQSVEELSQDEGKQVLAEIVSHVDREMLAFPKLEFAVAIWTRGLEMDPNAGVVFARPETHPAAPDAMRTIATATQSAASGLDLHGLDTPDRVCFYEQDFYVLSNFSAFAIRWRSRTFPTVEHAYHWEKFLPDDRTGILRSEILHAPSAHEAFKMGQTNRDLRRPDWDEVKVGLMQALLRAKVEQHEYVRRKLLATGNRLLVENSWRDDFWGWGPNRDGQNVLGILWMGIRAELRREPLVAVEFR